jgi:hypothetical protein
MLRSIALLMATLALTALCAASDHADNARASSADLVVFTQNTPARSPGFLPSLGLEDPNAEATQQSCCKICRRGKACGNTCISVEKVCHVGPGCACNG